MEIFFSWRPVENSPYRSNSFKLKSNDLLVFHLLWIVSWWCYPLLSTNSLGTSGLFSKAAKAVSQKQKRKTSNVDQKAATEQCFSVKLKAPVLVPTAFHNKTLTATQQHRIKKCKAQSANPFCWHKNYETKKCIHNFVHFVVGIQTASLKIWIRENPKSSPSLRQVVPPGFHLLLRVQNLIRQVIWDLEVKQWAKIQRMSQICLFKNMPTHQTFYGSPPQLLPPLSSSHDGSPWHGYTALLLDLH